MPSIARIPTLEMQQRSGRTDFFIREQTASAGTATPHKHDYFQIQINRSGKTTQHIGSTVRPFGHNTLAFIMPHRLHMISHPENGRDILINMGPQFFLPHLECDPAELDEIHVSATELPELLPFRHQEMIDFVLDDDSFAEVIELTEKMRPIAQGKPGAALLLRGYLMQLIGIVLYRYHAELTALVSARPEKKSRSDTLARIQRYIRQNLSNSDITLGEAAEAVSLSPGYLTHFLRKETGYTFSDLLLERRMQLARTHLINNQAPISQIAWACGFADEAYFSRRFRQSQGMPPGQFRKQHQNQQKTDESVALPDLKPGT